MASEALEVPEVSEVAVGAAWVDEFDGSTTGPDGRGLGGAQNAGARAPSAQRRGWAAKAAVPPAPHVIAAAATAHAARIRARLPQDVLTPPWFAPQPMTHQQTGQITPRCEREVPKLEQGRGRCASHRIDPRMAVEPSRASRERAPRESRRTIRRTGHHTKKPLSRSRL